MAARKKPPAAKKPAKTPQKAGYRTASAASTPQGQRIVEEGRKYWADQPTRTGKTAGIGYDRPPASDFNACVARVGKYLGSGAPGYCQERHMQATGYWAGHAPGERWGAGGVAGGSAGAKLPGKKAKAAPKKRKGT